MKKLDDGKAQARKEGRGKGGVDGCTQNSERKLGFL